ncbi:hypothetical protein GS597_07935 [Synechococcales cyanobacterium C]|uniref:Uncharacterized protein n=1 Tax=Petrachloros mirabilis ULC683 TaxID=2781853 RepID=A0A8K2A7Y5_9CYAN|nr:type IV pilus biogenesis protein EbsA [Petrachloros mirabilis]NCJ06440.1 hypothetical protein [Petrachloros mirabilis ULC683]
MVNPLDSIQPVSHREVNVYLPYYQGSKRDMLPLGISLYQSGNLEGARGIEGGENIPFVATWNVSNLPADLTRCRIQFSADADLSYEVTLTNFEFIGFLIELLANYKRAKLADFPKPFYRKLLRLDD